MPVTTRHLSNAFKAAFTLTLLLGTKVWAQETTHYEKALAAFEAENYQEAYVHVKTSLNESPYNLPSKILAGRLFLINRLYDEAETEFAEAREGGADPNLLVDDWGQALIKQRKFEEILALDFSEQLNRDAQVVWFKTQAIACLGLKRYERAERLYRQILQLAPTEPDARIGLANIQIIQENYTDALATAEAVLAEHPKFAPAWRTKGQVAKDQGELSVALQFFSKAFALDSENPDVSRSLVDTYIALKQHTVAYEVSQTILSQSPDDLYVKFSNSWLGLQLSIPGADDVLAEIAQNLSKLPEELIEFEPSLLYLRAMVSFTQDNFEQVRKDLTDLLLEEPENVQARVLLARALIALDSYSAGLEVLEGWERKLDDDLDYGLLLGNLYIQNRKHHRALSLLKKLEKTYPNEKSLGMLNVRLSMARGKIEDGLTTLNALIQAHPEDYQLLSFRILSYLELQRLDMVQKDLDTLKETHTGHPDVLNLEAASLILSGNYTEAETLLTKLVRDFPQHRGAQYNLANALYKLGKLSEAQSLADNLSFQSNADMSLQILRGRLYLALEKYADAVVLFERMETIADQSIQVVEGLARAYLLNTQLEKARDAYQRLHGLNSANPEYLIQLAQLRLKLGDQEAAKEAMTKLEPIADKNVAALIALNHLWMGVGDIERAKVMLSKAHALSPEDIELHLQWIGLMIGSGAFDDADMHLSRLVSRHPENLNIKFRKGELLQAQGRFQQANKVFSEVLEQDPDFELALAKLYSILVKTGQTQVFLSVTESLIEAHPDHYFPRSLLGQYHFYYGDAEEAIEQYEYILQLDSATNRASLLNRLATLYLEKDIQQSLAYASQAYALDSLDPMISDTYGWALTLTGSYEEALGVLREAYSRVSTNESLVYHLAYLLTELKRFDEARELLHTLMAYAKDQERVLPAPITDLYERLSNQG